MKCPFCKKENPEHPRPCPECGYDPTDPYEPPTSSASKAAWFSLILAILSFVTFLITAIPAIIFGCVALRQIRRSPDRLRGKRLAVASIVISIFTSVVILPILVFLWNLDAPPIPNDYTIADLRSAPEECAKSFDLLKSAVNKGPRLSDVMATDLDQQTIERLAQASWASREANARDIGLSIKDVNMLYDIHRRLTDVKEWSGIAEIIDANTGPIMQAWENGVQGRQSIAELNRFAEIADLTEPNMFGEWDLLSKLRTLAYLYNSASLAMIREGNMNTAIVELAQIDAVILKLNLNVRSALRRKVCVKALIHTINTANFIANDPNIPTESIAILANYFKPLTAEQTSFRNTIIFEYLTIQALLAQEPKELGSGLSQSLKYNSSCRLLRNFCDDWIRSEGLIHEIPSQRFSVWPSVYPNSPVAIKADEFLPWHYFAYNPIGASLISIITPAMNRVFSLRIELQAYDDLLQIVLNTRLGKPVNLKARAYGEEYIVDVQAKRIFSPGPDGKVGTKDDISLPINPAVLGWAD